jgi:hypothetical protein
MRRGSQLVIDRALQALGIETRNDLDLLCHRELRLEVNTYLHLSSLRSDLVWAAANPDGERRRSFDPLCFWFPKDKTLSLIKELVAPKPGSFEYRFKKFADYFRRFRAAQHLKRQERTASREEMRSLLSKCLQEKLIERNVYLWYRSLEDKRLVWVDVNPFNDRRKNRTLDTMNLWYPKQLAIQTLSDLYSFESDSFEEEFSGMSAYFRGFRTACEIKIELVKEQLKEMRRGEQAQLQLKWC